jgi:hypothetical protein
MEFILFGLIILFLVGISSDRTTRTPTQTFHTSSTNSAANIEKNKSQPSGANLKVAGSNAAISSWSWLKSAQDLFESHKDENAGKLTTAEAKLLDEWVKQAKK